LTISNEKDADMATADEVRGDLRKKLNRVFDEQLEDLLINRHNFRQLVAALNASEDTPQRESYFEFVRQCFVAFVMTTVRRIVDRRRDVCSLVRFLEDEKENLAILDAVRFSRSKVQSDIAAIQASVQSITDMTDTVVAHTARHRSHSVLPTYGELHQAIDSLESRYNELAEFVGAERMTDYSGYDINEELVRLWPPKPA